MNILDIVIFGKDRVNKKWKLEYDETIYKIYDSNSELAGYFFPDYGLFLDEKHDRYEDEEKKIETINEEHKEVFGGEVLLPLAKLDLLDIEEIHVDLESACGMLEAGLLRLEEWKKWMRDNSEKYSIQGYRIYNSREDKNMLSISIELDNHFVLHEKEIGVSLSPMLDSLSQFGLL